MLSRRERTEVNFAVSLLLEPGAPLPFAKLTLTDNGAALSSIALPLHPPDADGRLLAVGRIPIAFHSRRSLRAGAHHRHGPSAQTRRTELTLTDAPTGVSTMDMTRLKDFAARLRPGVVQSRPRPGGVVLCARGIAHDQRRRAFSWSDRDRGGGAILHDVIPGHGRHDGRCDHRWIAGDLSLDADRHEHGPWRHRQARPHQRLRGVDDRQMA